jgi:hypothetical protein
MGGRINEWVARPYLLDFPYQLSDFSHLSGEEIKGEIWLRVCLSVLRAIFHPGLWHALQPLIELAFALWEKDTGVEYIRSILRILQRRFGSVPSHLPGRLAELPAIALEELLDEALIAPSYEVFAARLTAVENPPK